MLRYLSLDCSRPACLGRPTTYAKRIGPQGTSGNYIFSRVELLGSGNVTVVNELYFTLEKSAMLTLIIIPFELVASH